MVIGNFPILEEFEQSPAPAPLRDRDPVALYLGSMRPDRGLGELMEAARYLPAELGARLRIAGELRPASLADEIRSLPWAERIEVLPERRSRAWVAQQLSEAAVGVAVQPPKLNAAEGWRSNKLFEYMAAGLPVIVADAPRWREIVDRYRCGIAVPADDPRAIADAIALLLRDRDLAAELGQNGREAVLRELNWGAESARLLDLYGRLVGRPEFPPVEAPQVAVSTDGVEVDPDLEMTTP